jgi:tetratricopeptide (TPR) repeat protein
MAEGSIDAAENNLPAGFEFSLKLVQLQEQSEVQVMEKLTAEGIAKAASSKKAKEKVSAAEQEEIRKAVAKKLLDDKASTALLDELYAGLIGTLNEHTSSLKTEGDDVWDQGASACKCINRFVTRAQQRATALEAGSSAAEKLAEHTTLVQVCKQLDQGWVVGARKAAEVVLADYLDTYLDSCAEGKSETDISILAIAKQVVQRDQAAKTKAKAAVSTGSGTPRSAAAAAAAMGSDTAVSLALAVLSEQCFHRGQLKRARQLLLRAIKAIEAAPASASSPRPSSPRAGSDAGERPTVHAAMHLLLAEVYLSRLGDCEGGVGTAEGGTSAVVCNYNKSYNPTLGVEHATKGLKSLQGRQKLYGIAYKGEGLLGKLQLAMAIGHSRKAVAGVHGASSATAAVIEASAASAVKSFNRLLKEDEGGASGATVLLRAKAARGLAELALAQQQHAPALGHVDKALETVKGLEGADASGGDGLELGLELAGLKGWVLLAMGMAASKEGAVDPHVEAARVALEAAVEQSKKAVEVQKAASFSPAHMRVRMLQARHHYYLGRAYWASGADFRANKKWCQRQLLCAAQLQPPATVVAVAAFHALGNWFTQAAGGDRARARKCLAKAAAMEGDQLQDISPVSDDALMADEWVRAGAGDALSEIMLDELQELHALQRKEPADTTEETKKHQEQQRELEKTLMRTWVQATRSDSRAEWAWRRMGHWQLSRGARVLYGGSQEPTDGNAESQDAEALLEDGVICFQQALRVRPQCLSCWAGLGRGYHLLGKHVAALKAYNKCFELCNPTDEADDDGSSSGAVGILVSEEELGKVNPDHQQQWLGEKLYLYFKQTTNDELAGKLTGMFLGGGDAAAVASLLADGPKFQQQVAAACEMVGATPPAAPSSEGDALATVPVPEWGYSSEEMWALCELGEVERGLGMFREAVVHLTRALQIGNGIAPADAVSAADPQSEDAGLLSEAEMFALVDSTADPVACVALFALGGTLLHRAQAEAADGRYRRCATTLLQGTANANKCLELMGKAEADGTEGKGVGCGRGTGCVLKLLGDLHTFGFLATPDAFHSFQSDGADATDSDGDSDANGGCDGLLRFLQAGAEAYTKLLESSPAEQSMVERMAQASGGASSADTSAFHYDLGVNYYYQACALRLHSVYSPHGAGIDLGEGATAGDGAGGALRVRLHKALASSIDAFRSALRVDPFHSPAWTALGAAQAEVAGAGAGVNGVGMSRVALVQQACLVRSLQLEQMPEAWGNLAMLYLQWGSAALARAALLGLQRLNPDSPAMWIGYALLHELQYQRETAGGASRPVGVDEGACSKASAAFSCALQMEPHLEALVGFGCTNAIIGGTNAIGVGSTGIGLPTSSVIALRVYLERAPSSPLALHRLGLALLATHPPQYEAAANAFERATDLLQSLLRALPADAADGTAATTLKQALCGARMSRGRCLLSMSPARPNDALEEYTKANDLAAAMVTDGVGLSVRVMYGKVISLASSALQAGETGKWEEEGGPMMQQAMALLQEAIGAKGDIADEEGELSAEELMLVMAKLYHAAEDDGNAGEALNATMEWWPQSVKGRRMVALLHTLHLAAAAKEAQQQQPPPAVRAEDGAAEVEDGAITAMKDMEQERRTADDGSDGGSDVDSLLLEYHALRATASNPTASASASASARTKARRLMCRAVMQYPAGSASAKLWEQLGYSVLEDKVRAWLLMVLTHSLTLFGHSRTLSVGDAEASAGPALQACYQDAKEVGQGEGEGRKGSEGGGGREGEREDSEPFWGRSGWAVRGGCGVAKALWDRKCDGRGSGSGHSSGGAVGAAASSMRHGHAACPCRCTCEWLVGGRYTSSRCCSRRRGRFVNSDCGE